MTQRKTFKARTLKTFTIALHGRSDFLYEKQFDAFPVNKASSINEALELTLGDVLLLNTRIRISPEEMNAIVARASDPSVGVACAHENLLLNCCYIRDECVMGLDEALPFSEACSKYFQSVNAMGFQVAYLGMQVFQHPIPPEPVE